MPVHIECFIDPNNESDLISELLHFLQKKPGRSYINESNRHVLYTYDIPDAQDGSIVLRAVFNMMMEENGADIRDLDLVIADSPVKDVEFIFRLDKSQDGNEYYEAGCGDQHFLLETVNRHMINEDIEDTVQPAALSLFPFRYSIYSTLEDLKDDFAEEGMIFDFDDTFIASGSLLQREDPDETWSLFIGRIVSGTPHYLQIGDMLCGCVILQVQTAIGILPAIIPLNATEDIQPDRIISLFCDVKADLSAA
ncbi:MAG: hypothetical protein IKF51_04240 [Solobacterium sp.]|nr:hypothetical protein [Solobacterium sp.]